MNVITGNCELNKITQFITSNFSEEFSNYKLSYLKDKLTNTAVEILCTQTFTFYANKSKIRQSGFNKNFIEYQMIIDYCTDLEVLFVLSNLDEKVLKSYNINWVIFGIDETSKEKFHAVNFLNIACFCDYHREESDKKKKVVYRIDFNKIEKLYKYYYKININLFAKFSKKYFFNSIFNLQISQEKLLYKNEIVVIKFEETKINNIIIEKKSHRNIYQCQCVICGNIDNIVLSKSLKGSRINSKIKYKKVSNTTIKQIKNNEFSLSFCNHIGTSYENKGIDFSFKIKEYNQNINTLDQVFLYYLHNFKYDKATTSILYFKNSNVEKFKIDKFIEKKYDK